MSQTRRALGLALLVIALLLVPHAASAVSVPAADDATTDGAASGDNFGADDDLEVKAAGGNNGRRTFIYFNIASVLPPNLGAGDVTSATLRLWVNRVTDGGTFNLHEAGSGWTEELITDASAPPLGTLRVEGVPVTTARKFITIDLTDLVKAWVDGLANNGVMLVPAGGGIDIAFDSKENPGTGHDPRLDIMVNLAPDITAVLTPPAGGLTGGGTSGSLSLSIQPSYKLPQTCANGQVTKWNGGTWGCADDIDTTSAGDITAVLTPAGGGLTGGADSGGVSLSLATGGVTAEKIASGEVVKSLNGLKDAVTLAPGANVTITPSGSSLVVAAASGIAGTGAATFVPKFTDATTVGASSLREVNGNLGVGTDPLSAPVAITKQGTPASIIGDGGSLQLGVANVPVGGDRNSWIQVINGALMLQPTGNVVGIGYSLDTYLPGHLAKLSVNGTITGTSKNFVIPHPGARDMLLIHSSLEGPENGVYYRGEARLVDGQVVITLPPYFEALTRPEQRTVHLTAIDDWAPLYVAGGVREGRFTVKTAPGGARDQAFYWEVKAVRADIAPLVVERAAGR
jgi:hypothetical protein